MGVLASGETNSFELSKGTSVRGDDTRVCL